MGGPGGGGQSSGHELTGGHQGHGVTGPQQVDRFATRTPERP